MSQEPEYKDLGWANGWSKDPPELVACRELGHRCKDTDIGPQYRGLNHLVRCDICKIVYHYDSGD